MGGKIEYFSVKNFVTLWKYLDLEFESRKFPPYSDFVFLQTINFVQNLPSVSKMQRINHHYMHQVCACNFHFFTLTFTLHFHFNISKQYKNQKHRVEFLPGFCCNTVNTHSLDFCSKHINFKSNELLQHEIYRAILTSFTANFTITAKHKFPVALREKTDST